MQRSVTASDRRAEIAFRYEDAEGRRSSRIVWPIVLGFFDDTEMLAAWCESRRAIRHFRLDRMKDWQVTNQRIPIDRHRLLSDYRQIEPGIEP